MRSVRKLKKQTNKQKNRTKQKNNIKGWVTNSEANRNCKQARITILILDKVNLKVKLIRRNKKAV